MKRCKFLSILIMAFMITCLVTPSVYGKAKTKIAINTKKVSIEVGEEYQLAVTGTKKTPTWTSANESVLTVNNDGVITGVSVGKAKVTAKIGSKKYSCQVTVEESTTVTVKVANDEYASEYMEILSYNIEYKEYKEDDEEIEICFYKDSYDKYTDINNSSFDMMNSLGSIYGYIIDLEDDNATFNVYYNYDTEKVNSYLADEFATAIEQGNTKYAKPLENDFKSIFVIRAYLSGKTIHDVSINYINSKTGEIARTFKYVE